MEFLSILLGVIGILFGLFGITWNKICFFVKRFNKPVDFTFENDNFARDTIKYRFRNIINNINNKYEDAIVSLGKKTIERPLDYD